MPVPRLRARTVPRRGRSDRHREFKPGILLAAPITLAEIETYFVDRVTIGDEIGFDSASLALRARRTKRLGAIALTEQTLRVEPSEETAKLLAEGIARVGVEKLALDRGAAAVARPHPVPTCREPRHLAGSIQFDAR